MSVINQMLKDLDKRAEQQVQHGTTAPLPTQNKSSFKAIIITIFIMLLLMISVMYFWGLYQENAQYKQQVVDQEIQFSELKVNEGVISPQETPSQNTHVTQTEQQITKQPIYQDTNKEAHQVTLQTTEQQSTAEKTNVSIQTLVGKNNEAQDDNEIKKPPSSLNISRKQLSPKELAQNKMLQAERAVAENDLAKAEQLFEEILLITPDNNTAYKQLAALLYGRKSYQAALNILQQGIITFPESLTLRLMKARIHVTLNQTEKAFDVLSPLPNNTNIEYQSLLASTAQKSAHYKISIDAYLTLINLAPKEGRYWLGLAISYDSNSEFRLAAQAYQQAINQGGLSNAALNFTQQRLVELGE